MNAPASRHEELLGLLQAALAADQQGARDDYQATVDALVEWRSRPLQTVLARLAQELSESLSAIPVPIHAGADLVRDLPDARSRLDYVVSMTEQAAHRTLDGVDGCRRQVEALASHPLPNECAPILDGLRRNLSEMALAQEYQDLSGQIIRRVISVVHRVEAALAELGVRASPKPAANPDLAGPAVPEVDHSAVSQTDADALLCGLGL